MRWKISACACMIAQDPWCGNLLSVGEHISRCMGWCEILWDHVCRHRFFAQNDVMVEYKGHDGGLTWTGVIAGWKQVVDLAGGAIYQGGIAHLQIGRQLGLGTSTVNLIVRRTFHYDRGECFKLSVVMEYINRDEWSCILEYQQRCSEMYCNDSIAEAPLGWRGNERIIEEMPKSRYQKDQKDVADVLRHIAHESMPLVLKYRHGMHLVSYNEHVALSHMFG
ncbi:hypothetical protein PTI98_011618 [Pleurotus ostreatus]|nr:hypothetical protein PTI98_011618 [Pleurotus ostreatus]